MYRRSLARRCALALTLAIAALAGGGAAPVHAEVDCTIESTADVIVGTSQSDVICGDDGPNVIYGGLLDDKIYGGGGNDVLIGGHGTDLMHGQTGDDVLRGGTNRDCYIGGVGTDTASFATHTPSGSSGGSPDLGGVQVDLTGEPATNGPPPTCDAPFEGAGIAQGEGFNEELVGIENLVGSVFDDDLEAANTGVNDIRGGWGDDVVRGRGGNDGLYGENGTDQCRADGSAVACSDAPEGPHRPAQPVAFLEKHGPETGLFVLGREGWSDDVLDITRSPTEVRIDFDEDPSATASCPQTGPQTLTCSIGAPDYVMAWGDQGNDTITLGATFPNVTSIDLNGGPGNDVITDGPNGSVLFSGEGGADQIYGNAGTDALISEGDPVGSGGDYLAGGDGNDQLVTDNACAGHVLWGGPDTGTGPVGDIIGFARQTDLGLPGGNRGVWAELGEGTTPGIAYATPQPAGCVVSEINGGGEVLEGTSQADVLRGNGSPNEIWGRDGEDQLRGLGGDDIVHGHANADRVFGDLGDDTVWGESGVDELYGNEGADKLRAADGVQDATVHCGAGTDFAAEADPNDPLVSCNEQ